MTESTTTQDCNCDEQDNACSIVHIHSPVTNINICSDGCCDGGNGGNGGESDNEGEQGGTPSNPSNPSNPSDGSGRLYIPQPLPVNKQQRIKKLGHDAQGGLVTMGVINTDGNGNNAIPDIVRFSADMSSAKHITYPATGGYTASGVAGVGDATYFSLSTGGESGILKLDADSSQLEYRTSNAGTVLAFKDTLYAYTPRSISEIGDDFRVKRSVNLPTLPAGVQLNAFTSDEAIYLHTDRWIARIDETLQVTAILEMGSTTPGFQEGIVDCGYADGHIYAAINANGFLNIMQADAQLDSRTLWQLSSTGYPDPLGGKIITEGRRMLVDKDGNLSIYGHRLIEGNFDYFMITLDNTVALTDAFTLANDPVIRLNHRTPDNQLWYAATRGDLRAQPLFNKAFLTSTGGIMARGPLPLDELQLDDASLGMKAVTPGASTPNTEIETLEADPLDITVTDLDMSGVLSA